jgi:hypothetical protein
MPRANKGLDVTGREAAALAQLTIFEARRVRQNRSFGLDSCKLTELHARD